MSDGIVRNEAHGFHQLAAIPDPEYLKGYYESKYVEPLRAGKTKEEVEKLISETARNTLLEDLKWREASEFDDIEHYLRALAPGPRVLDVGAGAGEVVSSLAKRGFVATGIEPSAEAVAEAKAIGVQLVTSDLGSFWGDTGNRNSFDSVLLMNVLEHVREPEVTLRQVRDLLKVGGVLMVRSPNDFSEIQAAAVAKSHLPKWWVRVPDHITYFSHKSLGSLLQSEGYEVLVETSDFPIDWFLLMGQNYVGTPLLGAECHLRRRGFELALPGAVRRRIYEALASAQCGRNVIIYARRKA